MRKQMNMMLPSAGKLESRGTRRSFLRFRGWSCVLMFLAFSAGAQTLEDVFTNRQTITSVSGQLEQSNTNATVEVGEPQHGGKQGGHSLWISWVAPTNGIVEFKTETSRFDTLLSAYQFTNSGGSTFSDLREVARADDSEGFERESEIEFGVLAGERYEIAVDGYRGAVGRVEFRWNFESLPILPAQILGSPADRSVGIGDVVTLSATITNVGNGQVSWYFNGNEIVPVVSTTNLTISSFQATNVGRYKVRVNFGGGASYYSVPADVQINTDGSSNTLAQPKFLDAQSTPLIGTNGGGSSLRFQNLVNGGGGGITPMNLGVVRGYNGSQIFNTTYATSDPLEPAHCNVPGGASYWLLYQPPTNGTITLDTIGSSYDTVMEVYTYNGTPAGYADLIKIDCNNNAFATNGASRVSFGVVKSRQYLVAVDGVSGARGVAWLNYALATNQLPQSPAVTGTPSPLVAAEGATVVMSAPVMGSPPLMFTWRKNGTLIPGVNSSPLVLANVTTNSTASYSFAVTNDLGGPAQSEFGLTVIPPPACSLAAVPGSPNALMLSFPSIVGRSYIVEDSTNLAGAWTPWPNFYIGDGQPINAYVWKSGSRFFRVRVE